MAPVISDYDLSGWDRRRLGRIAELEQLAMEMFAARGFSKVTVDEIAANAGVSARTLFRYFPVKEEILLGYVRRGTQTLVDEIAALAPDPDPIGSVWVVMRDRYRERRSPDAHDSNLWRDAAREAPEVVARAIGERVRTLMDAVTEYCARSLGLDAATDPRPRLMAGPLVGLDEAMVEVIGRSSRNWDEVLALGEQHVPRHTAGPRGEKR
ncbi:MAG: TetR family transcriptional regulator [Ilumatobacteraceae bacterium]